MENSFKNPELNVTKRKSLVGSQTTNTNTKCPFNRTLLSWLNGKRLCALQASKKINARSQKLFHWRPYAVARSNGIGIEYPVVTKSHELAEASEMAKFVNKLSKDLKRPSSLCLVAEKTLKPKAEKN